MERPPELFPGTPVPSSEEGGPGTENETPRDFWYMCESEITLVCPVRVGRTVTGRGPSRGRARARETGPPSGSPAKSKTIITFSELEFSRSKRNGLSYTKHKNVKIKKFLPVI